MGVCRSFLAAALLMSAAFVGTASASVQQLSPSTVGTWNVAGWTDEAGLLDRCVSERRLGSVNVAFVHSATGYHLVLYSKTWKLPVDARYKVQLAAGPGLEQSAEGLVAAENRLVISLGEEPSAFDLFRNSKRELEIRAARAVIRVPVQDLPASLTAVESCWAKYGTALANPFAATPEPTPLPAADAPPTLQEEQSFLEIELPGGQKAKLEAVIVRPASAQGRLPIALVTHGTTTDPESRKAVRAGTMLGQARDLAHRGWLAVAVTRRDYGVSDPSGRSRKITCDSPRVLTLFDEDAAELEAALKAVGARPDADPTRMIALGESGGGSAVLALAARRPAGLLGAVNISGGLVRIRTDGSHCPIEGQLKAAFSDLGKRVKVPTLWLYAQNDSFFPPEKVDLFYDAFSGAGGIARLVRLGPIGTQGHDMFGTAEGRSHWLPQVDAFLRDQGMPTWDNALIDQTMRVGRIGEGNRDFLSAFFSAPANKILVMTKSGSTIQSRYGALDMPAARKKVLEECEEENGEACTVLVENFELLGNRPAETASLQPAPNPQ